MKKVFFASIILCVALFASQDKKVSIKAVAIPLADHYAGIVAYEKYKNKMKHADYDLLLLPGPDLVRRHFRSFETTDIAFTVSPMVMDMFAKKPDFRWVSLIHRDGNALAVNKSLHQLMNLEQNTSQYMDHSKLARTIKKFKSTHSDPIEIAIPSPLATHTTILYKYLKDNNVSFSDGAKAADVFLRIVKPPKSIAYLKKQDVRGIPAAFEQSSPWPELLKVKQHGQIAWYSKDILQHPKGHVECVIIAKDRAIKQKHEALGEVIYYIHKAGMDIEQARREGGKKLDSIITMVQKHIPSHTSEAIKQSLSTDSMSINFQNLNVDTNAKESFHTIMDLAYEAGFIKTKIDIDALSNEDFRTQITQSNMHE